MTTAGQIVKDAFSRAKITTAEQPLEATELARGIVMLDRMLSSWEDSVVQLGYTPVSVSDDVLNVPKNAEEAIESHLALRLASEYSKPVDILLQGLAATAYNQMLIANKPAIKTQYPSTLPRGSGSEISTYNTDRFFKNDGDNNF